MELDCCDLFKALSVGTRIRIIELLKTRGPLGAKRIAALIGVTPAAVSQHLKTLKQVGLVRSERKGYWIPYEIDANAMEDCRHKLSMVCTCGCEGPFGIVVRPSKELDLQSLEKYQKALEKELRIVNDRIKKINRRRKR